MTGRTPISTRPDTLCPYATLFRSEGDPAGGRERPLRPEARLAYGGSGPAPVHPRPRRGVGRRVGARRHPPQEPHQVGRDMELESRFTDARKDCPHPERWHSPDSDSTEVEVSRLAAASVEALRPDYVLVTGTALGQTSELIGQVLVHAGVGDLVTFEIGRAHV